MSSKIQMPPNWQIAQMHAKSVSFGKPSRNNDELQNEQQICECCGNKIYKQSVGLCESSNNLLFIGIGVPLYFSFVKYCMLLLLVQAVYSSLIGLTLAVEQNYQFCFNGVKKLTPNTNQLVECSGLYVFLSRIVVSISNRQKIFRISYFLTNLIFLIYIRNNLIKQQEIYTSKLPSYTDFAIILHNLPHRQKIQYQIMNWLEQDYVLQDIVIIGSFQTLQNYKESISQKLKEKKIIQSQMVKKYNKQLKFKELSLIYEIVNQNLLKLQESYLQYLENQSCSYKNDQIAGSKAIIVFQLIQEQQKILNLVNGKYQYKDFPEQWPKQTTQNITIEIAPDPQNINWENMSISSGKRIYSQILGFFQFAIIVVGLGIIYYYIRNAINMLQNLQSAKSLSIYGLLIFVILSNLLFLAFIFNKLAFNQRYSFKTTQQFSFMLKYLTASFLMVAIVPIIYQQITNKNYYKTAFGLVQTQTILIFMISLLIPSIWIINPWNIVIRCKQMYYRNHINLSQIEANYIMEKLQYQISRRYAQLINIMWTVTLYESLIPLGSIVSLFGLLYYYWTDKCNLQMRCSIKPIISDYFDHNKIMTLLQITLLLKPTGQILFDQLIRDGFSLHSLFIFGFAIIYLLVPTNSIISWFNNEQYYKFKGFLSEISDCMPPSYQDLHPIVGKQAKKTMKQLKKSMTCQYQSGVYHQSLIFQNKSILDNSYRAKLFGINQHLKQWKKQLLCKTDILLKNQQSDRQNQQYNQI